MGSEILGAFWEKDGDNVSINLNRCEGSSTSSDYVWVVVLMYFGTSPSPQSLSRSCPVHLLDWRAVNRPPELELERERRRHFKLLVTVMVCSMFNTTLRVYFFLYPFVTF